MEWMKKMNDWGNNSVWALLVGIFYELDFYKLLSAAVSWICRSQLNFNKILCRNTDVMEVRRRKPKYRL